MFNPRNLPTCTITGRVTTMSGEPLSGAKVTVGHPLAPQLSATAVTAKDGTYVITGIRPERHQVWTERDGYASALQGKPWTA